MAIRYGGRHELEGGNESLIFPADGAYERSEREALRKELDEARKQGEAYARELAAVFSQGEEVGSPSTFPPSPGRERFSTVALLAGSFAAELRGMLFPVVKEFQALKRPVATPYPGVAEAEDPVESIRRRLSHVQDFLAGLAAIGELDTSELPGEVEFCEIARQAARGLALRAERAEVTIKVVTVPEGPDTHAFGRAAPHAAAALVRELLAQGLAASPRGSTVTVKVMAASKDLGTRILVDDAGAPLPASARRAFLALELDPGTYGRPSSLPLYICGEIASAQGALLELLDAESGGLRVMVTFPR
jgi:signal transduction histidine kinase